MLRTTEQLQTRIEALEAKDDIRALITAYGIACDDHDLPGLMDLFTEEAKYDSANGEMVATGKTAIEEMFIRTFKTRGPSFHWTHDITIELSDDTPDRATGLVLSHAETSPNGVTSLAAMRYADEYQRGKDGRWRIAQRTISFLYYTPVADYVSVFGALERVNMAGGCHPADHPEKLPSWQAFARQYGDAT